jgi:LysM repeat protein
VKHSLRVGLSAMAALGASACSHMPDVANVLTEARGAPVAPNLAPRERVRVAIELLGEGDERRAEAELQAALRGDANSSAAQRLLDQINSEPRDVLRGEARSYTVRQGETMSMLAERFQGDALLFYALARFNNLDAPNQVAEGQVLMIPRRPGLRTASSERPPPTAAAPASVTTSAPRGPNALRADQLRLQALREMNAGQPDRAVTLLRQAHALDADNLAVRRDLDRAERLQASLRAPGEATHR